MDNHLMGEFEADVKDLEADSWSFMMDKKHLKQLKKDVVKRQDVIYGKLPKGTSIGCISTFTFCCKTFSFLLSRAHPDRNAPRQNAEDHG